VADIKSTCHSSHGQNRFLTCWQYTLVQSNDRSLRPSLIVNGIGCSFSAPITADISGAGCFTVFLTFYDRAVLVNGYIACRGNRSREMMGYPFNYDYYVSRISHKRENRYRTDNPSSSQWHPHVVVIVSTAIKASSDVPAAVQDLRSI